MIRDGVGGGKGKDNACFDNFPWWEGLGLGKKITDKHDTDKV